MKKIIKSNKPVYYFGITWLIYAMFFPLYNLRHYLIVTVLSVIVYIFTKLRTPNIEIEVAPPPEPKTQQQLNLEKVLEQGEEYILELKKLDRSIRDEKVSKQILEIIDVSEKIFEHISEYPEKLKDIKMFMNYYLPTTVNVIQSYKDLSTQSTANSKDIKQALAKIEKMLDTSLTGFNNLHSSLFTEKVMDVSAEITVLEDLMEQHGLLDDQMEQVKNKEKLNKKTNGGADK